MKPKWFLLTAMVATIVFTFTVLRWFNSAMQRSAVDVIIYCIYVVGGALLGFAPFDRKRQRSRWARGVLALSAVILVFVGVAELLRHYSLWVLSPIHDHAFSNNLEGLRGIVMGFALALLFWANWREHRGPNQAMKRIAADVKTRFRMAKTLTSSSASLSAAIRLSSSR